MRSKISVQFSFKCFIHSYSIILQHKQKTIEEKINHNFVVSTFQLLLLFPKLLLSLLCLNNSQKICVSIHSMPKLAATEKKLQQKLPNKITMAAFACQTIQKSLSVNGIIIISFNIIIVIEIIFYKPLCFAYPYYSMYA